GVNFFHIGQSVHLQLIGVIYPGRIAALSDMGDISFLSSNPAIASVNANGDAVAVGAGATNVRVTTSKLLGVQVPVTTIVDPSVTISSISINAAPFSGQIYMTQFASTFQIDVIGNLSNGLTADITNFND